MKKTSLDVIKGIIEDLGGTSTAKTMVRVLEELRQTLSGGASGGSSGGSDSLVMHMTTTGQDGGVIECEGDKTFAQVYAQLQGGGDVIAHMRGEVADEFGVLRPVIVAPDAITFMAAFGPDPDGTFDILALVMSSDDTISMHTGTNQNDGEDGEDGGDGEDTGGPTK